MHDFGDFSFDKFIRIFFDQVQILENRVADSIGDDRASPDSREVLIVLVLLNDGVHVVCQVVEQEGIKNLIIDIFDLFSGFHFGYFLPLLFHVSVDVVLDYLHHLGNTKTIFSYLNSELFCLLVLSCRVISERTVLENFFKIVIAKHNE